MSTVRHSPAYVMQIAGQWRVVVPIRGKLTPKVSPNVFSTRADAEQWLESEDGQRMVVEARERRREQIAHTHHAGL